MDGFEGDFFFFLYALKEVSGLGAGEDQDCLELQGSGNS